MGIIAKRAIIQKVKYSFQKKKKIERLVRTASSTLEAGIFGEGNCPLSTMLIRNVYTI
jgi:hypothetical protein